MSQTTIGIVSPGEMGQAVGSLLRNHHAEVMTVLQGRSDRTSRLAKAAGFTDVGGYDELVDKAEMILCIVEPASAMSVSQEIADAMKRTKSTPLYVDANAVSPLTMNAIAAQVAQSGADVVDASIIGAPPKKTDMARFYASGGAVQRFAQLREYGLDVRVLGDQIGTASAMKMSFASITKGFAALATGALLVAHHHGVDKAVVDELRAFQPELASRAEALVPKLPSKSRRWVGEMEEIAQAYAEAGLPSELFQAIAELYRIVGATPLANEKPEDVDPDRTLEQVASIMARQILEP